MFTFEDLGNNGGYEKLAPTTSTGISASLLLPSTGNYADNPARAALVSVETNPIRYRMDGTAPTATEGLLLPAGSYLTVSNPAYLTVSNPANVKNFRCIDTAAGASSVKILVFY